MDKSYVSTKLRCYSSIIRLSYQEQGIRKIWSLNDVKNVVRSWFSIQQRELSVNISNLESCFYEGNIEEEPVVRLYGEIIRPDITDDKIKDELLSLFSFLKSELNQYNFTFYFQGYRENASIRLF